MNKDTDAETTASLALSLVPGIGPTEYSRRVKAAGTAHSALDSLDKCFVQEYSLKANEHIQRASSIGAICVSSSNESWPSKLNALRFPPPVLWMKGVPSLAKQRSVAIVGSRRASSGALRLAKDMAVACAKSGIAVVSGLARGVDAAAHLGALEGGGSTIAVLGTGVDMVYPHNHRELQAKISKEGLLVSEILPGEKGHAGAFPQRNRIIAALAEITVVVEAGATSGALITAGVASDIGRTVCAVPGSVFSPECAGTNSLIKDGAQVLCSVDDLLNELDIAPETTPLPELEGDAASCWDIVRLGGCHINELSANADIDIRRINIALAALELNGLIEVDGAGIVRPLVTSSLS